MEHRSSPELLSCLYRKQSKVKNLQFNGVKDSVDWQTVVNVGNDMACVDRLQLWLETKNDCGKAATVLERTRDLKTLGIHFSTMNPIGDDDSDEYVDDSPTLNLLLSKVGGVNQCSRLSSLRLSRIIFRTKAPQTLWFWKFLG